MPGTTIAGASPSDWTHFSDTLGLTEDLLPVVSDLSVRISADSKMKDLGKTPSRINGQGEAVGIPAWTKQRTTPRLVARWLMDSRLGICLQTRTVRALDIDIEDPVAAAAVREFLVLGLGAMPLRRRDGTGKCLFAFRMPGDFAKRICRTAHGAIEFLANGQQFVAVGAHRSGTRYEWVRPSGELGLPGKLPEVTPAEFEGAWAALVEAFAVHDGEQRERQGVVPVKPRNADDLRDPTVQWLQENGWVKGFERDGRVHVRCPWEGEHTTDTGDSSTTYFPAGIGGFARGHWRCLHAHCAGRSDGDFSEAVGLVGLVVDEFEVIETATAGDGQDVADATSAPAGAQPLPPFTRDRMGRIEPELNNLLMALRRPDLIGCDVAFDEFKSALMLGIEGVWRPFADTDYTRLRSTLEGRSFKTLSSDLVKEAVRYLGEERRFDSAKQWAETLQWDGVPRVDEFFVRYFGVEDTPYTRAVAAYTWTALAGRCVSPACKADMVPVLVGMQGAGKTTAVEALSPIDETFVEIDLTRKDDDIARSLRGKLVGEIAELRGLQGREAESIKAWISRRWEEWTPKYREYATRYPRRLLCIGTSNPQEFLDDDTGERRWLPMVVGDVDVPGVRAVRDQLWAEGLVRFLAGGVEWEQAQTLAAPEHVKFKVSDPWAEFVRDWLDHDSMDGAEGPKRGEGLVMARDVLVSAVGIRAERIGKREEMRIAKVLKLLGFARVTEWADGRARKGWRFLPPLTPSA